MVEIRTGKKVLAVGKACMAMFWPTPGVNGKTFFSSGFSTEGILISASAVPTAVNPRVKKSDSLSITQITLCMGKKESDWTGTAVSIKEKYRASYSRKRQTARPHSVHWWLSHIDQSGRGFTVKQGATTIQWDSAAYIIVSTSSLEVEAVGHALRWMALRGDSRNTRPIVLIESMSLLQKVEWETAQTGMCRRSTPAFENACWYVLPWTCRSDGKWPSG